MISRYCLSLAVLGFLVGSVARLAAEDIVAPPWDAGLPNQTSQIWEAAASWPPGTDISGAVLWPQPDPAYVNPFGEAHVTLVGTWDYQEINGPRLGQGPIPTWHVGEPGGSLTITIPNNPLGGDIKKVFYQITADNSLTPQGNPPTSSPSGSWAPGTPWQWPVDNWYTYTGTFTIMPNPASETITWLGLLPSTNISEIVIDTVCITIPEPGTLVLLGTAALGLLACAWRRRMQTR